MVSRRGSSCRPASRLRSAHSRAARDQSEGVRAVGPEVGVRVVELVHHLCEQGDELGARLDPPRARLMAPAHALPVDVLRIEVAVPFRDFRPELAEIRHVIGRRGGLHRRRGRRSGAAHAVRARAPAQTRDRGRRTGRGARSVTSGVLCRPSAARDAEASAANPARRWPPSRPVTARSSVPPNTLGVTPKVLGGSREVLGVRPKVVKGSPKTLGGATRGAERAAEDPARAARAGSEPGVIRF